MSVNKGVLPQFIKALTRQMLSQDLMDNNGQWTMADRIETSRQNSMQAVPVDMCSCIRMTEIRSARRRPYGVRSEASEL